MVWPSTLYIMGAYRGSYKLMIPPCSNSEIKKGPQTPFQTEMHSPRSPGRGAALKARELASIAGETHQAHHPASPESKWATPTCYSLDFTFHFSLHHWPCIPARRHPKWTQPLSSSPAMCVAVTVPVYSRGLHIFLHLYEPQPNKRCHSPFLFLSSAFAQITRRFQSQS